MPEHPDYTQCQHTHTHLALVSEKSLEYENLEMNPENKWVSTSIKEEHLKSGEPHDSDV